MADSYAAKDPQLSDPGYRHYTAVPSDTVDLPFRPRSLYISAGTAVVIRDELGNNVTYAVTPGQILPFRAQRILATGTNATVIVWY